MISRVALAAALVFVTACGHANVPKREAEVVAIAPAPAFAVPHLIGRVNDLANRLTPDEQADIASELRDFDRKTTNEIVVLVIPSIDGHTIEDAALTTANTWKIGKREQNNGVLLLIAVQEHQVRIATGIGIEAKLTDRRAHEILESEVTPRLRRGDYAGAIRSGVRAIEHALEE